MSKEQKRQELLQAAEEIFLRYGYRRTTLDDLSEAVGMRKSSLYHYFKGKDELFVETIRFLHRSVIEKVKNALDSGRTIKEAMLNSTRVISYYVDQTIPEFGDMSEHVKERMSGNFALVHNDYIHMITQLLDITEARFLRAVEDGELKPLPAREISLLLLTLFHRAVVLEKHIADFKRVAEEPEHYINMVLQPYLV